jgi:hypothetical protein
MMSHSKELAEFQECDSEDPSELCVDANAVGESATVPAPIRTLSNSLLSMLPFHSGCPTRAGALSVAEKSSPETRSRSLLDCSAGKDKYTPSGPDALAPRAATRLKHWLLTVRLSTVAVTV